MKNSKLSLTVILFGIAFIAVVALAGYFYFQLIALKKNPQAVAEKEVASLVSQISQLIVLPKDETPTIATVTDSEKLKDQAFFSQAQNGDKVLIYTNAKKAILYRPATDKIIDVAPLNIGSSQGTSTRRAAPAVQTPTPAPTPTPTPGA